MIASGPVSRDGAKPQVGVNSPPPEPSNKDDASAERAHDAALVARAARGDRAAFRELVERHQRRAHTVAYGLLRNDEDAREVAQEAFVRVYRHLGDFEGQASFSTWLYRIVYNLAIDQLRKRGPKHQAVELDESTELDGADEDWLPTRVDGDPLRALGRRRLVEAMQSALDRLPPYHRAVIVLREIEGLSYEEMAQALQTNKGTIMSRLFHARRKMQTMLREALGDEVPPPEEDPPREEPSGPSEERRGNP